MRLRRIALWFFGGCLLLLVAGFCWLWFGNIGVFKPQLEQLVFEKTGRELVIDGRFDVDLGRETVIIAEGIRFENADLLNANNPPTEIVGIQFTGGTMTAN